MKHKFKPLHERADHKKIYMSVNLRIETEYYKKLKELSVKEKRFMREYINDWVKDGLRSHIVLPEPQTEPESEPQPEPAPEPVPIEEPRQEPELETKKLRITPVHTPKPWERLQASLDTDLADTMKEFWRLKMRMRLIKEILALENDVLDVKIREEMYGDNEGEA